MAPADLWIESNVVITGDSDLKGKVSFTNLPMCRFLLRRMQRRDVREIDVMCSSQSGKTKTAEFALLWRLFNAPGPLGWYLFNQNDAREFAQTRLIADLEATELLRDSIPKERSKKKWSLIQFDAMNLYVMGANRRSSRERLSLQYVYCDERARFPSGSMFGIRNRAKTFRNSQIFSFSTPGDEHDEFHQGWLAGTRHFFFWSCLSCGHRQPFRFGQKPSALFPEGRQCGGLLWETNEITHPDERTWNIEELRKTVVYECENPNCQRHYRNFEKPLLIATMNESNDWGAVQTNPMASPEHISMYWNELYMPWENSGWDRIVEKFIKARLQQKFANNEEPMKVVVRETFGEPWQPEVQRFDVQMLLQRRGRYKLGEDIKDGRKSAAILTVDIQQGYLVYVLRRWFIGGDSRLISCGKLGDFPDLRTFQLEKNARSQCVWIDIAYEARRSDGYRFCAEHGWNAMLGDDAKEFTREKWDANLEKNVYVRSHWRIQDIDPNTGTRQQGRQTVKRLSWCNFHYKDLLYQHFIPGKRSAWEIPFDVPQEYLKQLSVTELIIDKDPVDGSEIRSYDDSKGRHDFADCELMSLVAADQSETIFVL